MKVLKYIWIVGCLSFGAVSCSQEDEPQYTNDDVRVFAQINSTQTRANTEAEGDKFLPGDIIKISMDGGQFYPYVAQSDAGGLTSFVPATDASLKWHKDKDVKINALVDNGDKRTTTDSFFIPSDQSSVEKLRKADWMTAHSSGVTRPADNSINLNFRHLLTKVTVVISEYSSNMSSMNVAKIVPQNAKMYSWTNLGGSVTTWLDLLDNLKPVGGLDSDQDSVLWGISPLISVDSTKGKHSFTAIICPAFYSDDDTFLSFSFNGMDYEVKANQDLRSLVAGKHYILNLKLNGKMTVSMSNVSVEDWSEGDSFEMLPTHGTSTGWDDVIAEDGVVAITKYNYLEAANFLYENPQITTLTAYGIDNFIDQTFSELKKLDTESKIVDRYYLIDTYTTGMSLIPDRLVGNGMIDTYYCEGKQAEWSRFKDTDDFTMIYANPLEVVRFNNYDYKVSLPVTLVLDPDQKELDKLESYSGNTRTYGVQKSSPNFWENGVTEYTDKAFGGFVFKKIIKGE